MGQLGLGNDSSENSEPARDRSQPRRSPAEGVSTQQLRATEGIVTPKSDFAALQQQAIVKSG